MPYTFRSVYDKWSSDHYRFGSVIGDVTLTGQVDQITVITPALEAACLQTTAGILVLADVRSSAISTFAGLRL